LPSFLILSRFLSAVFLPIVSNTFQISINSLQGPPPLIMVSLVRSLGILVDKQLVKDRAGSAAIESKAFFCPICGVKLSPEEASKNFCRFCGANLRRWGDRGSQGDLKG